MNNAFEDKIYSSLITNSNIIIDEVSKLPYKNQIHDFERTIELLEETNEILNGSMEGTKDE